MGCTFIGSWVLVSLGVEVPLEVVAPFGVEASFEDFICFPELEVSFEFVSLLTELSFKLVFCLGLTISIGFLFSFGLVISLEFWASLEIIVSLWFNVSLGFKSSLIGVATFLGDAASLEVVASFCVWGCLGDVAYLGIVVSLGFRASLGFIVSLGVRVSLGLAVSVGFIISLGLTISTGLIISLGLAVSFGVIISLGLTVSIGLIVSLDVIISLSLLVSIVLIISFGVIISLGLLVSIGLIVSLGVTISLGLIVSFGVIISLGFIFSLGFEVSLVGLYVCLGFGASLGVVASFSTIFSLVVGIGSSSCSIMIVSISSICIISVLFSFFLSKFVRSLRFWIVLTKVLSFNKVSCVPFMPFSFGVTLLFSSVFFCLMLGLSGSTIFETRFGFLVCLLFLGKMLLTRPRSIKLLSRFNLLSSLDFIWFSNKNNFCFFSLDVTLPWSWNWFDWVFSNAKRLNASICVLKVLRSFSRDLSVNSYLKK